MGDDKCVGMDAVLAMPALTAACLDVVPGPCPVHFKVVVVSGC